MAIVKEMVPNQGWLPANRPAVKEITDIRPEDVMAVYSGKPGCACGCLGKYSYNPTYRATASKIRGYEVRDVEISMRSVTTILRKVQAVAADVEILYTNDEVIYCYSNQTRSYMVRLAMVVC